MVLINYLGGFQFRQQIILKINMTINRTWLAFANENICNHRKALKEVGYVSWTTNIKSKFAEGDIVFLFMNDDRSVRFKLRVAKVNVPREDGDYWNGNIPNDTTYRLELVGNEYDGNLLHETVLPKIRNYHPIHD